MAKSVQNHQERMVLAFDSRIERQSQHKSVMLQAELCRPNSQAQRTTRPRLSHKADDTRLKFFIHYLEPNQH